MKKNEHFIVPSTDFNLAPGSEEFLSTYTFNTGKAKHLFCKICGICAFYIPRSNPDGYAITAACITPGTLMEINRKFFDGENWETQFEESDIHKYSRE